MSDHCHRNYVSDDLLAKRRAALDELTRISQEMGLYDEDFDLILIKRKGFVNASYAARELER